MARDLAEAARWFRKAADQGLADAQNDLGVMYQEGLGVAQDSAAAVTWWRKAAEQGLPQAEYRLGAAYHRANGVEQNYEAALHWYRKAATQGEPEAQYELGVMFRNGEGVAKASLWRPGYAMTSPDVAVQVSPHPSDAKRPRRTSPQGGCMERADAPHA